MSKLITQRDLPKAPAPRVTPRPIRMDDLKRKTDRHIDKGEPEKPVPLPDTVIATAQFVPSRPGVKVYSVGRTGKRVPKRETLAPTTLPPPNPIPEEVKAEAVAAVPEVEPEKKKRGRPKKEAKAE